MKEFWRITWRQVGLGLILLGATSTILGRSLSGFAAAVCVLTGGSSCIVGAILLLIGNLSRKTFEAYSR